MPFTRIQISKEKSWEKSVSYGNNQASTITTFTDLQYFLSAVGLEPTTNYLQNEYSLASLSNWLIVQLRIFNNLQSLDSLIVNHRKHIDSNHICDMIKTHLTEIL